MLVQCQPVSSDVCHCQTWVSIELVCAVRLKAFSSSSGQTPQVSAMWPTVWKVDVGVQDSSGGTFHAEGWKTANSSIVSTHLTALAGKRLTWESKSGSSDTGTLLMDEFGTAETSQVQLKHWSFRVSLKVTD